MLLLFRCENFKSFRDEQIFSLVAAKTRFPERDYTLLETPLKDLKVLRTAAVYGANASGKSNILEAMQRFSLMISESHRRWDPTGGVRYYAPFALDDKSRRLDTLFEIDFVVDFVVYNYGFSFNRGQFSREWLLDVTSNKKTLFRRTGEGDVVKVHSPGKNLAANAEQAQHLTSIKAQTRPNSLFLSAAAQGNHELLSKLFRWINNRFKTLLPRSSSEDQTLNLCLDDPQKKRQVQELLAFADTGITDFNITIEEAPDQIKKFQESFSRFMKEALPKLTDSDPTDILPLDKRPFVSMIHKGYEHKNYALPWKDESAGTRAYFRLLGSILEETSHAGLVIMDELESSLHPNLAKQVVRMFNDPSLNKFGAQLIYSTHSANLLDLSLLRRDQIWFAEKNDEGVSSLTSLASYKQRKNQDVAAAYLNGRFGAIPLLDENLLRSALSEPVISVEASSEEAL